MRLLSVLLVVAMLKPTRMIAETVDIGKSGTDFLVACSVATKTAINPGTTPCTAFRGWKDL